MTDMIAASESPATATAAEWTTTFETLKARYPKVREAILVALHILIQNPEISLDDAKAQAKLHGTRITAASVASAQRLLRRQDGAPEPARGKAPAAPTAPTRRTGRPRAAATYTTDPEALIRTVAEQIRRQSDAEAERLRAAVHKAIAVLQAAIEA
jgi:hypothetical protein